MVVRVPSLPFSFLSAVAKRSNITICLAGDRGSRRPDPPRLHGPAFQYVPIRASPLLENRPLLAYPRPSRSLAKGPFKLGSEQKAAVEASSKARFAKRRMNSWGHLPVPGTSALLV